MGVISENSNNRFRKTERLKKKKSIDLLFTHGKKHTVFPLVVYFLPDVKDSSSLHKAMFTVPKKHFKKAVVRNKIRRRIKEAFRIHKNSLYNTNSDFPFLIAYVYISKNVLSYKEIEPSVLDSLKYLENQIKKENDVAKD